MDQTTSHEQGIRKVAELLRGIRFAMLTSRGSDGCLRSRPMTTQDEDFAGEVWFFTGKDTTTAQDIGGSSQVNLAYADPGKNNWVSLCGEASLVDDPARKQALWQDAYQVWFPGGVEDPNLTLLRVKVSGAEYWDGAGKLTTLMGLARAALGGHPNPSQMGDSGKVEL